VVKASHIAQIDERDLQDKSKGDALSKGIVLLQVIWFVSQCIARYVSKLHVTELEIVTLGFATLNIATYIVWWSKPLRVDRPIVLLGYLQPAAFDKPKRGWNPIHRFVAMVGNWAKTVLGTASFDPSSPRVPILWAGGLKGRHLGVASATSALLAVVFGGVHCLAWWFQFPTWQEQMMWKISSAILVLVPIFFVLLYAMLFLKLLPSQGVFQFVNRFCQAVAALGYIAARLVLLGLTIMTLRILPDDAYQTIPWTRYIPHI
jgi:hypothetical protein